MQAYVDKYVGTSVDQTCGQARAWYKVHAQMLNQSIKPRTVANELHETQHREAGIVRLCGLKLSEMYPHIHVSVSMRHHQNQKRLSLLLYNHRALMRTQDHKTIELHACKLT